MTRHVLLLLAVTFVVGADDATDKDLVKQESVKLQGTWKLVGLEQSGRKSPKDALKNSKMVVTGDKYILTLTGDVSEGVQTIDPKKKPKWIDATTTKGEGKGQTYLGIYEVEGDTYKECYATPGKERPKEFKTEAESGQIMFTWQKMPVEDKAK